MLKVQEIHVNCLVITWISCTFALVDGSTKQVRPSQTGVGCTRKCRIYYHTANITLFCVPSKYF